MTAFATMPAIASTGAMLLTGQRSARGESALACRTQIPDYFGKTQVSRQVSGTSDPAEGAVTAFKLEVMNDGIPDPGEGNHAVLRATKLRVKSKSWSRTSQHDGFDDTPHA